MTHLPRIRTATSKRNLTYGLQIRNALKKYLWVKKVFGKKKRFICAKKGKWNIFEFYLINLI